MKRKTLAKWVGVTQGSKFLNKTSWIPKSKKTSSLLSALYTEFFRGSQVILIPSALSSNFESVKLPTSVSRFGVLEIRGISKAQANTPAPRGAYTESAR